MVDNQWWTSICLRLQLKPSTFSLPQSANCKASWHQSFIKCYHCQVVKQHSKPTKPHTKHCMKNVCHIYKTNIINISNIFTYICVVIRILWLGSSKSNFLGIFFPSFLRHQRFMVRPVIVLLPDDARIPGWRNLYLPSSTLCEVDIVSFFVDKISWTMLLSCWWFFQWGFSKRPGSILATSDPSYPKLDLLKGTRLGLRPIYPPSHSHDGGKITKSPLLN